MRLLVISYHYTPQIMARAFRWSALAEYWAKQGHEIDVVCAWASGLKRLEALNKVRVFRTGGRIVELLLGRLTPSLRGKTGVADGYTFKRMDDSIFHRTMLLSSLSWLHNHTWKKIYWPDFAGIWYLSAKRKVKQLLKKHHYHGLISVSQPFTGHLVGLTVKRLYLNLKWTVDIGDPFCFVEFNPINNHKLYKKLNYAAEQRVFNCADSVVVTNKSTLNAYTKIFPECAEKVHVIPPLLSLPENYTNKMDAFKRDDKIKLVFLGTLYKGLRNPAFLLKLFNRLLTTTIGEKLELHFWGSVGDCADFFAPYRSLLGSKIFLHGIVDHDKAFQVMKEADILVNIGNNVPYHLPSKVVEYASTGKPVLNLVTTVNDSSYEFFSAYPACLSLLDNFESFDQECIANTLYFIDHPRHISSKELEAWLQPFRKETITSEYEMLLNATHKTES